jgi:hypothetical protein
MLLHSSEGIAAPCQEARYIHRGKPLCFSSELRTYLSPICLDKGCQALDLLKRAKGVNPDDAGLDSRHPGSKICILLGGETRLVYSKTKDQLCVCEMGDRSVIACTRLAM